MTPLTPQLIDRDDFAAPALMEQHPPKLRNRNKQIVFDIACPKGCRLSGTVAYSRWREAALPSEIQFSTDPPLLAREDQYDYVPIPCRSGSVLEWHVNFADPRLFIAYGSGLFAQDEIQVAEHPVLASLKEALHAAGRAATTVADGR